MSLSPLLAVSNLRVSVEGKEVVRGVSLNIAEGEIHAVMGPNGSGKSTLVNALMGHPAFTVTGGSAAFAGKDLLALQPWDRAAAGLFLAFQYPKEISGVTLRAFLFAAYNAQLAARDPKARPTFAPQSGATGGRRLSPIKFKKLLEEGMAQLKMDAAFAERPLNKGFSGGEKKKAEVLQMGILRPRLALLDETDSGLDIDALKIVADGINGMRSSAPTPPSAPLRAGGPSPGGRGEFAALVVTHYARLLDYVTPDRVHVMINGKIAESGGAALAQDLEKEGYARFGVREEEKSRIALD